jgi:hypothetical protein
MTKAEQEKTGLKGTDKQQGDLQNTPGRALPEGLQRERSGALDKNLGRNEDAAHVPGAAPVKNQGKDDLGFPKNDESKFG